jgi:transcription elongation factor GreA
MDLTSYRQQILGEIEKSISDLEQQYADIEVNYDQQRRLMREAREEGDLSENAAYTTASEEVARLEAMKVTIYNRLQGMRKVNLIPTTSGYISVGSMVHLASAQGNVDKSFLLVNEDVADSTKGRVSVTSPVGEKIVGKTVGDDIVVTTQAKTIRYRIMEVL